jgi:hypothetical protein
MADCIACSPLIRSLALHPNTMGNAPYVQFGRNRLWVRVIVGYLPKQIKSIFLHTTINWAAADCFACGAATPNLRAGASSQHLGRLPLTLVWSGSIVGASNWGGSADVTQKRNFYTQQSTMREDDDENEHKEDEDDDEGRGRQRR